MKTFQLVTRNFSEKIKIKYSVYVKSKQNCIQLIDSSGSVFITASRSVDGLTEIGKKSVLIKNTGECVGVLENLIKNGIVKDSGIKIRSGFYNLNLCQIIDPEFKRL